MKVEKIVSLVERMLELHKSSPRRVSNNSRHDETCQVWAVNVIPSPLASSIPT